jgi:hypothetical protein
MLVVRADLDVTSKHVCVITLHQGVQGFMKSELFVRFQPDLEITPADYPLEREDLCYVNYLLERKLGKPFAVKPDFRFLPIKELESLLGVKLRHPIDCLSGYFGALPALACRVADSGSVIADEEYRLVAQLLKLAELLRRHHVAYVKAFPRRIHAEVYAQRAAFFRSGFYAREQLRLASFAQDALAARVAEFRALVGELGAAHKDCNLFFG